MNFLSIFLISFSLVSLADIAVINPDNEKEHLVFYDYGHEAYIGVKKCPSSEVHYWRDCDNFPGQKFGLSILELKDHIENSYMLEPNYRELKTNYDHKMALHKEIYKELEEVQSIINGHRDENKVLGEKLYAVKEKLKDPDLDPHYRNKFLVEKAKLEVEIDQLTAKISTLVEQEDKVRTRLFDSADIIDEIRNSLKLQKDYLDAVKGDLLGSLKERVSLTLSSESIYYLLLINQKWWKPELKPQCQLFFTRESGHHDPYILVNFSWELEGLIHMYPNTSLRIYWFDHNAKKQIGMSVISHPRNLKGKHFSTEVRKIRGPILAKFQGKNFKCEAIIY